LFSLWANFADEIVFSLALAKCLFIYLFASYPFFSEAASSANGIAIVEARDLPVFFSGVFFFYSFLFFLLFLAIKTTQHNGRERRTRQKAKMQQEKNKKRSGITSSIHIN